MNVELVNQVKEKFQEKFTSNPIVIFSPGRINIIGEHTDYNDGFVFPAAVDKGIVAALGKASDKECSIYAVNKYEPYTFSLDTVKPIENGGWRNYVLGVVGEIQKKGISLQPFDIAFGGDIPGGAGMSSSAALENSVVFGLNELFDLGLTKKEMILISQMAEHNYVGVKCGIMDQYASMFGVEDCALQLDCRTIESNPFKIDFQEYQLLLINTNVKHSLNDSAYNDRRSVCENIASLLKVEALRDVDESDLEKIKDQVSEEDYQKALYVIQENNRVIAASEAMEAGDLKMLGQLLYGSHNGLQHQYQVSCEELDFLVDKAKKYTDVLGARMMGGGFGGCTINLIKKTAAHQFKEEIAPAYRQEFNKDCSFYFVNLSDGTKRI